MSERNNILPISLLGGAAVGAGSYYMQPKKVEVTPTQILAQDKFELQGVKGKEKKAVKNINNAIKDNKKIDKNVEKEVKGIFGKKGKKVKIDEYIKETFSGKEFKGAKIKSKKGLKTFIKDQEEKVSVELTEDQKSVYDKNNKLQKKILKDKKLVKLEEKLAKANKDFTKASDAGDIQGRADAKAKIDELTPKIENRQKKLFKGLSKKYKGLEKFGEAGLNLDAAKQKLNVAKESGDKNKIKAAKQELAVAQRDFNVAEAKTLKILKGKKLKNYAKNVEAVKTAEEALTTAKASGDEKAIKDAKEALKKAERKIKKPNSKLTKLNKKLDTHADSLTEQVRIAKENLEKAKGKKAKKAAKKNVEKLENKLEKAQNKLGTAKNEAEFIKSAKEKGKLTREAVTGRIAEAEKARITKVVEKNAAKLTGKLPTTSARSLKKAGVVGAITFGVLALGGLLFGKKKHTEAPANQPTVA